MSFTIDKLDKPTNATGTLQAGGSLDANTTYHYKIIAFSGSTSYIYANRFSEPSDTITVTTDTVNKTIKLDWDVVPDASRYWIARIKDGESFDATTEMYLAQSHSSPYAFDTNTKTDDGWVYQISYCYYECGMPFIIVDAGTSNTIQELAEWAETNGHTNYVSVVNDNQFHRGILYKITGDLTIEGEFICGGRNTLGSGMTIFIDGQWDIVDGGNWECGYNPQTTDYNNEGVQIIRTGKYSVGNMRGTMNWQQTTYHDIGLYDRVYLGGKPYLSHQIIRTSGGHPNITFKKGLWRYGPLESYGSTIALIEDSTVIGISGGDTKYLVRNCNFIGNRVVYNYYASKNVTLKGLNVVMSGYEFFFHKHSSYPAIFYTVDCNWYNSPVKANKSASPTIMQVWDSKTFNCVMSDEEGNPINGVTATITNTQGEIITMTSNSEGKFYLAAGNPTSGTTTTVTDTSLDLEVDSLKNKTMQITYGTVPTIHERIIASNTSDTITIQGELPASPDSDDYYFVEEFLTFNKYVGSATNPYPYAYDLTTCNPFTFKFEKAGYTSEEINNFNVVDKINWAITMNVPEVPIFEGMEVSITEDSITADITDDNITADISSDLIQIDIQEE